MLKAHNYIPEQAIEDAIARMRQRIVAGRVGATDALLRYSRLAEAVLPAFMRWDMDEINAQATPEERHAAMAELAGWFVGQAMVEALAPRLGDDTLDPVTEATNAFVRCVVDHAVKFCNQTLAGRFAAIVDVHVGGQA